jgi:hypothetical protein
MTGRIERGDWRGVLNVRSSGSLDKTLWRSRIFGFCPQNLGGTLRKSLGGKALAKRINFLHRSNATKCKRFVRWRFSSALDFSRKANDALDTMRRHFVPFSRFSRKKEIDF